MTDNGEIVFDYARRSRIGLDEAVFCAGKSANQIVAIVEGALQREVCLLLTRLSQSQADALRHAVGDTFDYCEQSRTAIVGMPPDITGSRDVAIVVAGTSDVPVAREAERTLRHTGIAATMIADVGVAGLWRLGERLDEIGRHRVVIAVAGMDAALASVLGGLIAAPIVCVPTSVGYGAADGGRTALNAMLSSCAPGLLVCNIDNGYGAACAAIRLLRSLAPREGGDAAPGGAPT